MVATVSPGSPVPLHRARRGVLSTAARNQTKGRSKSRPPAGSGAQCTFVDLDGHHWIRIYIEKTLRVYEQMPIPTAVHHAITCLEEISADARAETGNDSLWQYWSTNNGRFVRLRPKSELNTLSRFLDGEIHERWKFHAHQFRRFFAMVYFWRYEPGDVAALAHHLRHFDLEMTRQYVTDGGFSRI